MVDLHALAASAIALIAAAAAIIVAVRKTTNEVASLATSTALSWAGKVADLNTALDIERESRRALQAELCATQEQLRKDLAIVKRTLIAYRKGVHLLIDQITDLGHVAAWQPPEE